MPFLPRLQARILSTGVGSGVVAIALVAGSPAFSATAQESTPVPVVCNAEPRPVDFIVELIAQPVPEITPEPLTGVPEGSNDVDPETRATVVAVLEELTACVNAGEVLRAFSLFEDAYLRRVIDPEGLMTDNVAQELGQSFATPSAVDSANVQHLEEVVLVRALPDGSVAIAFRTRVGDGDESQVDLLIMREIDGEWLIVDGLTDLDPEALLDD